MQQLKILFLNSGGAADECSLASNIYQCGREKAPVATAAIQASIISKAAAAAPVSYVRFS